MSAPAFTPGPWQIVGRQSGPNGAMVWSVGGQVRVGTISNKADKPISQKWADAHLIAAAPELYRELSNAVVLLRAAGVQETDNGTIRAAEAALAKARGEQ